MLITGFLFPLPKAIFPLIDVFFGAAGSSWVVMKEGGISISIDVHDYQPIGVLGHTTNNSLLRSAEEPPIDLCKLLNEVLFDNMYQRTEPLAIANLDYTPHFEFLSSSVQEKVYYDVFKIKNYTLHSNLMKFFISFLGPYKYIDFRKK